MISDLRIIIDKYQIALIRLSCGGKNRNNNEKKIKKNNPRARVMLMLIFGIAAPLDTGPFYLELMTMMMYGPRAGVMRMLIFCIAAPLLARGYLLELMTTTTQPLKPNQLEPLDTEPIAMLLTLPHHLP